MLNNKTIVFLVLSGLLSAAAFLSHAEHQHEKFMIDSGKQQQQSQAQPGGMAGSASRY